MPREPENTGRANAKGRTIWRGPRGGEYVLVDGRRLRPAMGRQPRTVAAAAPTGQRDANGRHVLQGPRGGLFVVDDAGNRRRPATAGQAGQEGQAGQAVGLMNLPDDVLRHIARQDPRAAVKLAATSRGGLRVAGPAARAATAAKRAGQRWRDRASSIAPFAKVFAELERSRAFVQPTLEASRRALERIGFVAPVVSRERFIMSRDYGHVGSERISVAMGRFERPERRTISVSIEIFEDDDDEDTGASVEVWSHYENGRHWTERDAYGGDAIEARLMDLASRVEPRLFPDQFPWQ